MYKKKQDEIIERIQTNMLKSEQLDQLLLKQKQTANVPKAQSRKIQAKEFEKIGILQKLLQDRPEDTSREFMEEETSETQPYCLSSLQVRKVEKFAPNPKAICE